jgi:hypothetical protein
VAVAAASVRDVASVARQAAGAAERRAQVLAAVRDEPAPVLTEDALVSLAAGKRPAISDPAVLRSLSRAGDPRARATIARLAGDFELVVLNEDLDRATGWYRDYHLGPAAADILRSRYSPAGTPDGYHLYRRNR